MTSLAVFLSYRGDWPESIELLRQVVSDRESKGVNSELITAVRNLAIALHHFDRLEEAEQLLNRYIPVALKLFTAEHMQAQSIKAIRARVWLEQGHATKAVSELQSVLHVFRKVHPKGHWRIASTLVDEGRGLLSLEKVAEAEAVLAEARNLYRKYSPPNEYYQAWAECCHAEALAALNRKGEAEKLLLATEPRLAKLTYCPKRYYRQVLGALVKLYTSSGNKEAAAHWGKKLDENSLRK